MCLFVPTQQDIHTCAKKHAAVDGHQPSLSLSLSPFSESELTSFLGRIISTQPYAAQELDTYHKV